MRWTFRSRPLFPGSRPPPPLPLPPRLSPQTVRQLEERLAGTVHEAAALGREVDDLRGELGNARTKIGVLEAELARTRLEEKEEMEE